MFFSSLFLPEQPHISAAEAINKKKFFIKLKIICNAK